jgi:hypothetical protein
MMKTVRKLIGLVLALTMLAGLCVPALAVDSDAYWEAYDEGWNAGYTDGFDSYGGAGLDGLDATTEDGRKAGYADGYITGYFDAEWEELYEENWENSWYEDINDSITAHGGVPGTTNVMVNGTCMAFDEVGPENVNGRVMVPMRAITEKLGAEVGYDQATRTATIVSGETTVTHVIGTDTITVQTGETAESVQMDCVSYLRNGTTMVPVRFVADALGCSVEWDGTYKTVVILDLDAIKATYDSQLTVFNRILQDSYSQVADWPTYASDTKMDLNVTLFDSLNGNRTYGGSLTMNTVANDEAANYDIRVDLTDLVTVLEEMYGEPAIDAQGELLLKAMKELQFEVIYDQVNQRLYVSSPIISLMAGEEGWLDFGMEEIFGTEIPAMQDGMTLSDLMVMMTDSVYSYETPFNRYDMMAQMMEVITAIYGDQNFTKSGNTYTMKMSVTELLRASGMSDDQIQDQLLNMGSEDFKLEMQVTMIGDDRCDYSLSMEVHNEDLALSIDCDKSGTRTTAEATLHMKNVFEAVLTAESVISKSNATVVNRPAEGENILNLMDV